MPGSTCFLSADHRIIHADRAAPRTYTTRMQGLPSGVQQQPKESFVQVFSLQAQVCGHQLSATVSDAGGCLTVETASGPLSVRSLADAERVAERQIGLFLQRAERGGVPWGRYLSAGQVAAVYGDWPLLPGPASPRASETPVSRIRSRWRPSDGPLSALGNAMAIIRAYSPRRAAA